MAYQTARQIEVAYKEQDTIGTLPSAGGAKGFRANTGGLNLTKTPIQSNENRRDGQSTRGRHGSHDVQGQYAADLSVGSFDDLVAAMFWGTFSAALELDESDFTSITTTANTIVRPSGSWITDGLRVGDVIRLTNHLTAGNNSRNLRIIGLTATVITVAETLTLNATPDDDCEITRPKKVLQGTTRKAFAFEEREIDIDGSEMFEWCRMSRLEMALQPNGMGMMTFGLVGRSMSVATGAGSPYFTDPAYTTSQGLTAVEAKIMLGTTEVVDLSAASIVLDRRAAGFPVVGSNLTPDVFDNNLQVTGSISGLRQDFARTQNFLDEDDLSLWLLFAENTAEPAGFVSIHVPYLTLSTNAKSELGQDGPRTQTLELMIGSDPRGGAYEPTMVKWQTSAV
ncbi:phage tail tube protein [Parvibaculum sp.]|uniref:phage tail tube protein n=1 Tax=Parvibaculum sp. TaxID=2024848 RepID=UPI001D2C2D9B|nr:phage tail tube protein [Parvibaculum sp.]MBX3490906.1 hypothetical protein [Parvibaculum sp.]